MVVKSVLHAGNGLTVIQLEEDLEAAPLLDFCHPDGGAKAKPKAGTADTVTNISAVRAKAVSRAAGAGRSSMTAAVVPPVPPERSVTEPQRSVAAAQRSVAAAQRPAIHMSGRMHGKYMSGKVVDVPAAFELRSCPGTFVFCAYEGGHMKMATVALDAARKSTTPPALANRYITSKRLAGMSVTAEIANQMWEGTYNGMQTKAGTNGYQIRDVHISFV